MLFGSISLLLAGLYYYLEGGISFWPVMLGLLDLLGGMENRTDPILVSVLEETVERIGLLELGLFSCGARQCSFV